MALAELALRRKIQQVADQRITKVLVAAGDEEQDDEAVDIVTTEFLALTAKAQGDLLKRSEAVRRATGADEFSDDFLEQLDARQTDDRNRASVLLAAGLLARIRQQLHSPAIAEIARGEVSNAFTVPAGLIREALIIAGGSVTGDAVNPVTGAPQGGLFTGATARDLLHEAGATPVAWQWVYGSDDRKNPFPGHEDLDGQEFLDWQDNILAVQPQDSWLDTDYYYPGDHTGCLCEFAPVIREAESDEVDVESLV